MVQLVGDFAEAKRYSYAVKMGTETMEIANFEQVEM